MKSARFFMCIAALILLQCLVECKKSAMGRKARKNKIRKTHQQLVQQKVGFRRLQIVTCCGRQSCSKINPKSRFSLNRLNQTDVKNKKRKTNAISKVTSRLLDPTIDDEDGGGDDDYIESPSTQVTQAIEKTVTLDSSQDPTVKESDVSADSSDGTDNEQEKVSEESTSSLLQEQETSSPSNALETNGQSSTLITTLELTSSPSSDFTTSIYNNLGPTLTTTPQAASVTTTEPASTIEANTLSTTPFSTSSTITTMSTTSPTTTMTTTTTSTTATTTTPTTSPPTPLPIHDKCGVAKTVLNGSLFTDSGALKDPSKYGFWVHACGKQYLFGKQVTTADGAFSKCLQLGMVPVAIKNLTCFTKIALDGNWPPGLNYWTSGKKFPNETYSYGWCVDLNVTSIARLSPLWARYEPGPANDGHNCIQFKMTRATGKMLMYDRNCSLKFAYACEGATTPPPQQCRGPTCPKTCIKDNSLFTRLGNTSVYYIEDTNPFGTWMFDNKRIYLYSNKTATWEVAYNACCSIGMKLLSFDFNYKYEGVLSSFKNLTSGQNDATGSFWTSGTDNGCQSTLGWCSVNRLVRNARWKSGQPGNGANPQCVTVNLAAGKVELSAEPCATEKQYICESRDTRDSATAGRAIYQECGALFNVSEAETALAMLESSFPLKIKCFLKCVGEYTGVFWDGKLIEDNMIASMEEKAADDLTKLQSSLNALDMCGNAVGMDECDTAANIFSCANKNDPDVVIEVINNSEINATAEASPLKPTLGVCLDSSEYVCTIHTPSRRDYLNMTATRTIGAYFRDGCGKRFVTSSGYKTFKTAFEFCCLFGLRPISLDTVSKATCVSNLLIGIGQNMFTSGSRAGTGVLRWCTSDTPFSPTIQFEKPLEQFNSNEIYFAMKKYGSSFRGTLVQEGFGNIAACE